MVHVIFRHSRPLELRNFTEMAMKCLNFYGSLSVANLCFSKTSRVPATSCPAASSERCIISRVLFHEDLRDGRPIKTVLTKLIKCIAVHVKLKHTASGIHIGHILPVIEALLIHSCRDFT